MVKSYALTGFITGVLLLTGCSTHMRVAQQERPVVEHVNSSSAVISSAYVKNTEAGLELRGKLRHYTPSQLVIPGQLHVELIGNDDKVFKTVELDYSRVRVKSGIAKFHLMLGKETANISRIRIAHYNTTM